MCIQRELDLLDDEDLYLNLIGGDAMEVDERRWLAPVAQAPTAVALPDPPRAEERMAPVFHEASVFNSNAKKSCDTWSWSSSDLGFFDCIQVSSCSFLGDIQFPPLFSIE